jgi:F5/8 type C domain/Glycosyl hydrolases family 43
MMMSVHTRRSSSIFASLIASVVASVVAHALVATAQTPATTATTTADLPRVGLAASLVATKPEGPVDNALLKWNTALPAEQFTLERAATESGAYTVVYTGTGVSFRDYHLPEGTHHYRLRAKLKDGETLVSNTARLTTQALPEGLKSFSNQTADSEPLGPGGVKVGETYYRFEFVREGPALKHLMMKTSGDGHTWQDAGPVMETADHPDLADCKFEAVNVFYDGVSDRIVYWCHWEPSGPRYGAGKALVASAKPGEKFTIHHVYRPLGVEVRDMNVFIDNDKTGYLIAAANLPGQGANATLYIFKLNDTYTDVVEITARVMENGYREAPCVVNDKGIYYLFYSQAAGWFPSMGGYISARSMTGPWSEPRTISSPSTFSSQSGHVAMYGADSSIPLMMGNRWMRAEGTNRQVVLPVRFADGFAFNDFAPSLLHDRERSVLVPLDQGMLLSQDRPVTASLPGKPGHDAAKAVDGDYFSSFQSDDRRWPFDLTVDLGKPSAIRNVQTSWFLHKGSEAFYTYTIEGSLDGENWSILVDHTDASSDRVSKTFGFTSDELTQAPQARYVRLKVLRAHLHNNPNNWYLPTIYELKVFGEPVGQ